jgi:hypothetical protein
VAWIRQGGARNGKRSDARKNKNRFHLFSL